MLVDENDNQSTHGNKVMRFIYFTMYGMILVALTPNYHIIDLVSWTLLVTRGSNIANAYSYIILGRAFFKHRDVVGVFETLTQATNIIIDCDNLFPTHKLVEDEKLKHDNLSLLQFLTAIKNMASRFIIIL